MFICVSNDNNRPTEIVVTLQAFLLADLLCYSTFSFFCSFACCVLVGSHLADGAMGPEKYDEASVGSSRLDARLQKASAGLGEGHS